MTTVPSGGFRFLSHQRRGLIALPGVATSGTVQAAATMSDGSSSTPVTLALANLGDVLGLDTTLVTRKYPRPGATDVETEFFPLIEFSAPELPWLMPTPNSAQGPMPWLTLVVVEAGKGISVTGSGGDKPDVLHIDAPASAGEELPSAADSALWAHAFAATAVQSIDNAEPTETTPGTELAGSRLIAARKMKPNTSYIAALVPIYSPTALIGLGRSDKDIAAAVAVNPPAYAWTPDATSVQLPAYVHWEFATGAGGDFQTLAQALKEVPVPADFGTRPLDLGLAGPGMPVTTSLQTIFRGALTAPGIPPENVWPDPSDSDQTSADNSVVQEINLAATLTAQAATTHAYGRPVIGPLLYARAAAGRNNVSAADPAQDWFDQLNRDPRARSVAGLGTRVMRRNVEDLMTRAWKQVGEVELANAALRRLQMSRSVAASLMERHIAALPSEKLLSAARPLLGRVAVTPAALAGTTTPDALAAVALSSLPAGTTWRGLVSALRPGTRLGDTAAAAAPGMGAATAARFIGSLSAGIEEPHFTPDGTLGLTAPSKVFGTNAAMFATDGFRAAAAGASLSVADASADPTVIVASLDTTTEAASGMAATAAGTLAEQTGATIQARQLPATVNFAQQNGMLLSPSALSVQALNNPIAVHLPGDQGVPTVLSAPAAAAALPAMTFATPHLAAPMLMQAAQAQRLVNPVAFQPTPIVPITPSGQVAPIAIATTPPPISIPVTPVELPVNTPVLIQLAGTDPRLSVMQSAYASAVDRLIRPGIATSISVGSALSFDTTRNDVIANLAPSKTVALLAAARVPELATFTRLDPVAPVMVGPVFGDAAYSDLATASHDAFVPGLDSIPPDSVTLLETNPTFIAAYLAGLNSAFGHELLWRGYPTDERGTYWHSFWGAGPEIGPLHMFEKSLPSNLIVGKQPLLVLVLKGKLLKRYPDADIYAVLATTDTNAPELDDGTKIVRPIFRDPMAPDIMLVGFPLTYDDLKGGAPGTGYWFVIAEHPGQPRFGLTDPDAAKPHPPLPTWDELSWTDLGPTAAVDTYVPAGAPPMAPAGSSHTWATSAADMAAITYQPAVRVAIRASQLLRSTAP